VKPEEPLRVAVAARQAPSETMTTRPFARASGLRERVRVLIEDVRFEKGMTALIVANAITVGLEKSPAVVPRIGGGSRVTTGARGVAQAFPYRDVR
jgi:hypothetical protein